MRKTFTVVGVVFDVSADSVLLRCVGAHHQIALRTEQYIAGKRGVSEALGIIGGEVNFVGMTLVLDADGIPALPPGGQARHHPVRP